MIEAALAWHAVLGLAGADLVQSALRRAAQDLARRDIDHWLHLELEAIAIVEHLEGTRSQPLRDRLVELGRRYAAGGVLGAAMRQ